ncbi:SDR family NAD(P)-dependent oxidoreductase [Cohaesibacter gelatinilyticus]|uniref:Short-chain dehydrogenase n=1 Tax=Cohaesibacter gelatinilyticus TaxID=372072 RepID=A0A285PCP8_9HYPH|nr:SDR family NAD(P)-dependent oxidoreductase [Cohaesibacter gelatinilyticus]SNZ19017.1 Short-chain dehydrogenase [Cohaesibacter gelatinilyticus]
MAEHYQTIWIIGASSGIGAALARHYAKSGHKVIVSARRAGPLQAMAEEYSNLSALPLDVEKSAEIEAAVANLQEERSVPDLVLYCAAVYEPGGLDVTNYHQASSHMQVNYLGFVGVLDAITPVFKQAGRGHLSVVASLSGYRGLPNAALYGPTKAALINLCETIKPEFDAMGLQISVINPGFVKTPMTDKNSFSMPFLITSEQAAEIIASRLNRSAFEIAFPLPMVLILKILRLLPYRLYFWLSRRMIS